MRMRIRGLRALVLIALTVQATVLSAASVPVLRVDAAHDAAEGRRAEYTIPPSSSLVVDTTGYSFNIPPELRSRGIKSPTRLNILIDRRHAYFAQWRKGRIVLDARSLRPMPGRLPFQGFRSGQKIVLGIGLALKSRGQVRFFPFWAGVVNVR